MVGFADETVVGGGESVGARLRRAREAHGLSLDEICARTRVPTRHLKAIEEDAFDQLPAAPYSVGFAKAFADAVGLNRDEIGREFRAEKEGYGATDAMPSYAAEETAGSGLGRGWIVLVLLVIAAVVFGLWRSGILGGSGQVETPAVAPAPTPSPATAGETMPSAAPTAAPMVSPSGTKEAGSTSAPASSQEKRSTEKKSEKSTSATETEGENRTESRSPQSSDKGGTSPATSTTSGETPKPANPSTRDLNLDAQRRLSPAVPPAGATTPAPAPALPVLSPPPPPSSTPSSAPSGTTP
jgi:cytoskeletal protein RodZ